MGAARDREAGAGADGDGMQLRAKLARLGAPQKIEHLKGLIAGIEAKRPRFEVEDPMSVVAQARESAPAAVGLVGEHVERDFGTFFRQVTMLEPHHCHGAAPVAGALGACPQMIAKLALDPTLEKLDLSRALFLDTETTGLSLGAGTVPFLVGLGRFEDESFALEQLLLEDLDQEAAMLNRLRELVEEASCIVTYNGKSYDWPLLQARFVMNRVAPPAPLPHVDLLHMARRVFRPRLGGARLVRMEEEVLGMTRERDIDGAEIPGVYWSYLRHKNGAVLALVMEHNANDIVALAALLAVLAERMSSVRPGDDPIDHYALAKVSLRGKDHDRALSFAAAAAEGGGDPGLTADAELMRGDLLKRRGEFQGARAAYETSVEAAGTDRLRSARAHFALAKLHEHKLKNLERALVHSAFTEAIEGREDMDRRRKRLVRRIERAAQRGVRQRTVSCIQ